jgi:hypothetical protein
MCIYSEWANRISCRIIGMGPGTFLSLSLKMGHPQMGPASLLRGAADGFKMAHTALEKVAKCLGWVICITFKCNVDVLEWAQHFTQEVLLITSNGPRF